MANAHSKGRKPVTTRHDTDVVERLQARAKAEGRSMTDIADELYRAYLDGDVSVPAAPATALQLEELKLGMGQMMQGMQALVQRVDAVQPQDTVQPAVHDYGEQLDLIERKMDVLQQGMLAMAERQAAEVAAIQAIAERQERHGQGMVALAAGMQRLAEANARQLQAREQPALPEPKQKLRKAIPTALDDCAATHARVVYVRM